jgi:hypothetical protein
MQRILYLYHTDGHTSNPFWVSERSREPGVCLKNVRRSTLPRSIKSSKMGIELWILPFEDLLEQCTRRSKDSLWDLLGYEVVNRATSILVFISCIISYIHQPTTSLPSLYRLGIPLPLPLRALCAAPGGNPLCGACGAALSSFLIVSSTLNIKQLASVAA